MVFFLFKKLTRPKMDSLKIIITMIIFVFTSLENELFFLFQEVMFFSFASSKDQKMNSLKTKAINEQKVLLFFFRSPFFGLMS